MTNLRTISFIQVVEVTVLLQNLHYTLSLNLLSIRYPCIVTAADGFTAAGGPMDEPKELKNVSTTKLTHLSLVCI